VVAEDRRLNAKLADTAHAGRIGCFDSFLMTRLDTLPEEVAHCLLFLTFAYVSC